MRFLTVCEFLVGCLRKSRKKTFFDFRSKKLPKMGQFQFLGFGIGKMCVTHPTPRCRLRLKRNRKRARSARGTSPEARAVYWDRQLQMAPGGPMDHRVDPDPPPRPNPASAFGPPAEWHLGKNLILIWRKF